MPQDSICLESACALAAAIVAKEVSSRELLELFVARIERIDPSIGAVVTFDLERARAAAVRADEATVVGERLGPLHGLPITIKDAIETEGIRSTGGAVELAHHIPTADAPAVGRLRAAGAIVFGKTNLPRWSGDVQTFNEMFGTTNNPWDLTRVPGGSSGGAAAAVACGFTSFELGTDIGGSVRIPAHFNGVFGLKPSFGLVSQHGYLDRVGGGVTDADINVFGPIARSADDLALLLEVLAGPDPERAPAWRIEPPGSTLDTLRGVRLAVWFDDPYCVLDRSYADVLRSAADRASDLGAIVTEARPPVAMADQVELFNTLVVAAIAPSMPVGVGEYAAGSHLRWLQLQDERARLQRTWAQWFAGPDNSSSARASSGGFDALLCPVTPSAAFPHTQDGDFNSRTIEINGGPRPYADNISWTGLIGVVGLPAAVPPLPRTGDGLPVGVQVVTPFARDHDAIRIAGLLSEASGGGFEAPPLAR